MDLSKLEKLFCELDLYLTGKNMPNKSPVEHIFKCDVYYLSDGGYSRVGYSELTNKLFLTSESRDEVKSKWNEPGSLELRVRIETLIFELLSE